MASASKTPNLNLPQWVSTEKPERTDFNKAFNETDTAIGSQAYTNQNYVTNGESVTASIDALDVEAAQIRSDINADWATITLANGWTNAAEALQVRKLLDGTIQVTGNIAGGTRADATTIGTIPSGYRPSKNTFTTSITGSVNLIRVYVLTTGEIKIYGANADATSLYIQFQIATT